MAVWLARRLPPSLLRYISFNTRARLVVLPRHQIIPSPSFLPPSFPSFHPFFFPSFLHSRRGTMTFSPDVRKKGAIQDSTDELRARERRSTRRSPSFNYRQREIDRAVPDSCYRPFTPFSERNGRSAAVVIVIALFSSPPP